MVRLWLWRWDECELAYQNTLDLGCLWSTFRATATTLMDSIPHQESVTTDHSGMFTAAVAIYSADLLWPPSSSLVTVCLCSHFWPQLVHLNSSCMLADPCSSSLSTRPQEFVILSFDFCRPVKYKRTALPTREVQENGSADPWSTRERHQ